MIRYESSRGHKIDGTKSNQTGNIFRKKKGKQTEEKGQNSSQKETSSPGRDTEETQNKNKLTRNKNTNKSKNGRNKQKATVKMRDLELCELRQD